MQTYTKNSTRLKFRKEYSQLTQVVKDTILGRKG